MPSETSANAINVPKLINARFPYLRLCIKARDLSSLEIYRPSPNLI